MSIKELEKQGWKRIKRKLSTIDKMFGSKMYIKKDVLIYVFGNKKCVIHCNGVIVEDCFFDWLNKENEIWN